jgi:hypothetical protein
MEVNGTGMLCKIKQQHIGNNSVDALTESPANELQEEDYGLLDHPN